MPEPVTEYVRSPRPSASALMPPGRGPLVIDGSGPLAGRCPAGGKWALRETDGKWALSEIADGTALGCQRRPAYDARWMISTPHDRYSPS
jgi:hypothetical protein